MELVTQLFLALALVVGEANAQSDHLQTIINGKVLTAQQKAEFSRAYGVPPLGGNFWYDPVSGLWGVQGREAFGVLRPGHTYGPLSPAASGGSTGVFINGRQLNMAEALYIRNLLGAVLPGQWWLDGATGNFGLNGSPMPAGNVFVAARAAGSRGGHDYYKNGMTTSGAAKSLCRTGTVKTGGDNKIDYIIGCE